MTILTVKQKYKFKPYKKNYPALYKIEKQRLKQFLPHNSKIEHIGSTAIPGLGGKGIIDIVALVDKEELDRFRKILETKGYIYKPNVGNKDKVSFVKDYKNGNSLRRVHVHLTYKGSKTWTKTISFRDYLLKNKNIAKEYAKIKKEAAKLVDDSGKIYRKYKSSFVDKITILALKEFKQK
jgi:GrpB-like predicted nucleotidyltransferase (UPF0157 family)